MAHEIKYTTGPETSQSSATSDSGAQFALVLPASKVRSADIELRQRIAVAADLSWTAIARLAANDMDVLIRYAANDREASQLEHELTKSLGFAPKRVSTAAWLPAFRNGFLAWIAGLAVIAGLAFAGIVSLIPLLVLGALVFVGAAGWTFRNGQALRNELVELTTGRQGAVRALPADVVSDLTTMRRLSMEEDYPVEAQVDLWTNLEAAESALMSGDGDAEEVKAAVSQMLEATAGGQPSKRSDAVSKLRTTAARISSAVSETGTRRR